MKITRPFLKTLKITTELFGKGPNPKIDEEVRIWGYGIPLIQGLDTRKHVLFDKNPCFIKFTTQMCCPCVAFPATQAELTVLRLVT
jgi:hypothetical protein